jgi:hypothetical protein
VGVKCVQSLEYEVDPLVLGRKEISDARIFAGFRCPWIGDASMPCCAATTKA